MHLPTPPPPRNPCPPQGPVDMGDGQLPAVIAGNQRSMRSGVRTLRGLQPGMLQAALDEHPELLQMLLRGMNARVVGGQGVGAGSGAAGNQGAGAGTGERGGGGAEGDDDEDEDEGGPPHEIACRVA